MSVVKKAAERAIVRWAYNQLQGTDPRRQDVFLLVTNRSDQIAEVAIDAGLAAGFRNEGAHAGESGGEVSDPPKQAGLVVRPRRKRRFDELVARFEDGIVQVETLSSQALSVSLTWDDGRRCHLMVSSGSPLRYTLEGAAA